MRALPVCSLCSAGSPLSLLLTSLSPLLHPNCGTCAHPAPLSSSAAGGGSGSGSGSGLQQPAATTAERREASLPWVEKYRPSRLDELVSQQDIVSTISRLIDANRLPHLLFYGPPGTGKTTTILALARKLYGPNFQSMVLEVRGRERGEAALACHISSPAELTLPSCPPPPFPSLFPLPHPLLLSAAAQCL